MLIEYTAYDRNGQRVSGTMEAGSEKAAEDILWQADLIVARVRKVRNFPKLHALFPSLFGVKEREVIAMTRQLATLLDSGLPLLLALQALSHASVHPMIKESMDGGQFSDGMARYPNIFPVIFVRMARIGEQTGDLGPVLRRGADYLENQAAVKTKLRGSLTYPVIVGSVALVSVYILVNFTIPMLRDLLDEFESELPLVTKIIVAISNFANSMGLWILLLVTLSGALVFLYRKRPNGRMATDRILLRLPMLGPMIQKSSVARLTQTLASLLLSGIPLLEAVELTRDSTDNAVMKQALEEARLLLMAGNNFADALDRTGVFPPMLNEMVRVGENAGNLSEQLAVASNVIQQDFDAAMSRMLGLIEPLMILAVGGVIAVIGVTLISTVYSILPDIGSE